MAMRLETVSTDNLPARKRVEFWNDVTSSSMIPQVADPFDPHRFCGRMAAIDVDDLRILEVSASASKVTRSRAHVATLKDSVYLLRLQLRGHVTAALHDGVEITLRPGDFTLYDPSRTYVMLLREDSANLVLRIPRDRLQQYIGCPEAVVGLVMPGDSGVSAFVSRYLREFWQAANELRSYAVAPHLSAIMLQLIASAYAVIPRGESDRASLLALHRTMIVRYIERHLRDPDLTPTLIASKLGITPGYLHRLFSSDAETISRYILRRRLEECSRALRDPARSRKSVTMIAFEHGFSSLPHFCRVFRERFGVTAGDFRAA